jgi:alpha-methylacyl-CoA racemase
MLLAFGVVSALWEAGRSGTGQVVDAAMMDGAASLATMLFSHRAAGMWEDRRGVNILDTGAHFYEVYETADGGYFAVGAIEAPFYAALLKGLGLDGEELPHQMDRAHWVEMKERFDEWVAAFDGLDACATPVLSPGEAPGHPHVAARRTYVEIDGVLQPAPAPRFDRTQGEATAGRYVTGQDADAVLQSWGLETPELAALREGGSLT